VRAIAEESIALLKEVHSEIRTLSYLLHPPLLDEVGLVPALTWYIDGFKKRSGIDARLSASPDIGRGEADIDMALFRIVQESLTNVHRHSGSKTATIRLERTPAGLELTVSDAGRGSTSEAPGGEGEPIRSLGVGIAGMKARVKQLGGTLDIRSTSSGTTVTVVIPHARRKGTAPVA
jgi:signal transduction histidine kinase